MLFSKRMNIKYRLNSACRTALKWLHLQSLSRLIKILDKFEAEMKNLALYKFLFKSNVA